MVSLSTRLRQSGSPSGHPGLGAVMEGHGPTLEGHPPSYPMEKLLPPQRSLCPRKEPLDWLGLLSEGRVQ